MNVVFALEEHPWLAELVLEWSRQRPTDEIAVAQLPAARARRTMPSGWVLRRGAALIRLLAGIHRPWPSVRRTADQLARTKARFDSIDDPALVDFTRAFHADLLVTWRHARQPAPLRSAPHLGVVDVHPGRLPRYRGRDSWWWELAEERRISVTFQRPTQDGRPGDQLGLSWHPLEPRASCQRVLHQATRMAAHLLPTLGEELEHGTIASRAAADEAGPEREVADRAVRAALRAAGHPPRRLQDLLAIVAGRHDRFVPDHELLNANEA